MTADEDPTVESILAGARQAGMPLTEAEAADLVKGVRRMQEMARSVRGLLQPPVEPAPVFSPQERPDRP